MATLCVVSVRSSRVSRAPPAPSRPKAHKLRIFANGNVYLEDHAGRLVNCEINAFRRLVAYLLDCGLVTQDTRLWIEGVKEPTTRIAEALWLRLEK